MTKNWRAKLYLRSVAARVSQMKSAVMFGRSAAPATALPGEEVLVRADAVDNIAVQSVAFTVNGGAGTDHPAAPYERRFTIPAVASPGTVFVVRAVALDPSNNSGAAIIMSRMCCHMWIENSTPS